MKKILIMFAFCVSVLTVTVPSSYADELVCGTATVNYILLHKSDASDTPLEPCTVEITIDTVAGNNYTLPAGAVGTQLNLGLLQAFMSGEIISICLNVTSFIPFEADILRIDFALPVI